ncbi:MAG: tRNA (N(6)-L-threonylcarbamoyladenosine(37)-C(2))-methylthiotransferase MtaB [Candidatus Hydrogenedentes bacterium]|nr:tRNA (N(6)-L-threonylcarbamoyladenosine(37)-C(2))-methylthiotransferase MtaB [Candidatus Hydrogenedentota bacterium]
MPRRASLHTLGCRLNQSETQIIREKLEARGYEIVPFGAPADLGIINTCTVTNEADAKSRKFIRSFIRRNPGAYVAVIGCYSQMGHRALSEIEGIDLILGNQEKLNVLDFVEAGKNDRPLVVRDTILRDDFTIETEGFSRTTRRANLKIQDGCDFMCSFCVIPFARGRARSRNLDNLLEEARRLAQRGAKELVLTGVNVGTYAWRGHTILDVLDRLDAIEGLERIRISSIEPTTIPRDIFDRMNDPGHTLVPYLHIPLQSGSDRVLELMRRKYTRKEVLDFVETAAREVDDLCIGTDILVGSPGERQEDFEQTCDLIECGPFAYAHVFKYSERDGTAAVRYADKVDEQEKSHRSARARRLSAMKQSRYHERFRGRRMSVLFEQEEHGWWSGYTGNYIRVSVCSDDILENRIREVTLGESCGDFVTGRIADTQLAGMCM